MAPKTESGNRNPGDCRIGSLGVKASSVGGTDRVCGSDL